MRAVVTGATGFIGRRLVATLAAEDPSPPTVLSRDPAAAARSLGGVRALRWIPEAEPAPADAFRETDGRTVDAVFHLAGEPVADGRWTREKRRRIRQSREVGTRNLVATLSDLPRRPRVLVAASAVGYYGDRGDQLLDEGSPPADDFLAEVCRAWEAASLRAEALGVRVVLVRIGIVLGEGGGALARMERIFKLGLGGRLGRGHQYMPWIHRDDVVGLLLHAARTETLRGPLNAVAPEPATNRAFTEAYARVLGRPALLPVPRVALRLALGELASVLLASQRVVPRVALAAGYRFRHPELDEALRDVVGRSR